MQRSEKGNTGPPVVMQVERGKIREFARAIRDDNPIYFDDDHALRTIGGIMPPPTFTMSLALWDDARGRPPLLSYDRRRLLHGEQEFEYLQPVYAGDTLTGVTRVADVFEKRGARGGTMTFGVLETVFTNQRGERVLIARSTVIETAAPVARE